MLPINDLSKQKSVSIDTNMVSNETIGKFKGLRQFGAILTHK
jgi:hypothetical protein